MDDNSKRQGTRVFKKSSPNGKITVYLGKRDFVDHVTHVDPIDGVVLIDPDYLKDRNRKVFCQVLAAFRYGREDLDVLGLTFRKDLFFATSQIFPPPTSDGEGTTTSSSTAAASEKKDDKKEKDKDKEGPRTPTRLQERLMKKLGPNAYPFFFELPPNCSASVTLQPAPGDTGKPCGIDYELRAFVAESAEEKLHKRNSVRLAIRKVMYAPSKQGEQPYMEVSKDFMMCPNKLHLEVSLDKELYYHGETINVNVHVQNNSNRSVRKIKISVRQFADICLFSSAQYKCSVAELESEEGCPVTSGFNLSKVYSLRPSVANNKYRRCLALDGQLKHEDTNLASSTYFPINTPSQREHMAIVVQYKVKVKLCLGALGGDLVAELPFMLVHPKPPDENGVSGPNSDAADGGATAGAASGDVGGGGGDVGAAANGSARPPASGAGDGSDLMMPETNLIQLDDPVHDEPDDIIFEDFARLRLKGETDA